MSKLRIQDESGDKKYFTIIPNYILNHSTLWDREVYIQMKRIAGEDGTCWTSRRTLARQCGISERRLDKSLAYLVEHKWISRIGVKKVLTAGGVQEVNEYRVADLWKLNIEFYESKGVAPETPPTSKGIARKAKRYSTDEAKGIAPGAHKEEPIQIRSLKDTARGADKLIPELINLFKDINPSYKDWFARKPQREAARWLITEFGFQRASEMVAALPKLNAMPYAPTATSPYEVKNKYARIKAFLEQERGKKKIITKSTPNFIL